MSCDARDDSGHRWSGWPGAFCMYCGSEDVREICLSEGDHELECTICVQPKCQVPDSEKDRLDQQFNPQLFDVGDTITPPAKL